MANSQLETLYREWLAAAARRDDDWYLENLAEDFVYIALGGGTMTRAELIAANNLGENGSYRLLAFDSNDLGGIWQCWGRYSARCDIPASVALPDEVRAAYARGCELAFINGWRPLGENFECVSHATVVIS